MSFIYIGIIILLVGYTANRFIMTEASKKLDAESKVKIFDEFSKRNNYASVFILILILFFFGGYYFFPQQAILINIIYLFVFGIYQIYRFVSNHKKLKELQMPPAYINSFKISYGVFALGVLGFVVSIWLN